jgi:hypothetical protein
VLVPHIPLALFLPRLSASNPLIQLIPLFCLDEKIREEELEKISMDAQDPSNPTTHPWIFIHHVDESGQFTMKP